MREGGVKAIEVTMTTPNALDVIRDVSVRMKDMDAVIGVGTVLDPETARAAMLAGAEYVVSPTLNLDVIKMCKRYSAIVVPGAYTPTEILTAWEAGADIVKVFPATGLGAGVFQRPSRSPAPAASLTDRRSQPRHGRRFHQSGSLLRSRPEAISSPKKPSRKKTGKPSPKQEKNLLNAFKTRGKK